MKALLPVIAILFPLTTASFASANDGTDDAESGWTHTLATEDPALEQEVDYLPPADIAVDESGLERPANPSQIKILGKGVTRRGSPESVAVVCVGSGQDCGTLQFAYFASSHSPVEYLGQPFRAPSASDSRVQRKALKLVIEEYMDYHQTWSQKRRRWGVMNNGAPFAGAGIMVIGLILKSAPAAGGGLVVAGPAVLVMMGAAAGAAVLLNSYSFSKILASGHLVASEVHFTEQDGWNWADHAHKIGQKKFGKLMSALRFGNDEGMENFPQIERRYQRKKKKLTEAGAQF